MFFLNKFIQQQGLQKVSPFLFKNAALNLNRGRNFYYFQKSFFSGYRKPSSPWNKPVLIDKKKKIETVWEAGLWLAVFGMCYMAVPFYTLLCAHFGFDTNLDQKDYSVMQKDKKRK